MADLAADWLPSSEGIDDRAQLLVVASVGFAVILIALALALNTAVYSDVHVPQTDSGSFEERSVTGYENGVERGIAALLPLTAENETETELLARLRGEGDRWENLTRSQYARDGVATNISIRGDDVSYQDRIVHDNRSRAFENRTGAADWSPVSNVSDDVVFRVTVTNETLAAEENDTFALEVTGDGGGSWSLSVFSTAESEIVAEINGNESRRYATNDSTLRIDVANGVFDETGDGEGFTSFVDSGNVAGPYDLRYRNATNASGTYYLFEAALEESAASLAVDGDDYVDEGSPRVDLQIGAVTVDVGYRSPELRYRTDVRAVAGEIDE